MVRRLRLLMVTFDPPDKVGGVEGRARAYTQELVRAKHFVELIALAPRYDYSETAFHGATLHRYPSSTRRAFRSFREAVRQMRTNSIDSVFLLSGALTVFGLMTLAFARMTGRRTLVFVYGKDLLGARGNRLESALLILSSRLSQKVAVNSKFTASLLPRSLSKKTGVIYPGVDPAIAKGARHVPEDGDMGRAILFVGRLVERKGADDLIRAFGALDGAGSDAKLEIVGDGPDMPRLRELATKAGVGARTSFFGTLTGERLYERFSNAYLFAMPSRSAKGDAEGFGTVFLEAGLFGKPSIGTRSGGIPEAIRDGETGILVPEHDSQALRDAIQELLSDGGKARRMGENAREMVESNFTWAASTRALLGLLGVVPAGTTDVPAGAQTSPGVTGINEIAPPSPA
jgi:glycosyltransferase involved in cell wall biosynthesis